VLQRLRTPALVVAALAVFGLIGWKAAIPSGPLPDTSEYRALLKLTADNVSRNSPDDTFRTYAINVVHTAPFREPFVGYGIYLGQGIVVTAAHVVGNWPLLTNPRVLIGGQDLAATVVKEGVPDTIDLALLSVDQTQLPIALRMRRNPLCKGPLMVGRKVVVAVPQKATESHIISPQQIAPELQARFNTLIGDAEVSGSGVFDADRKCLQGIISRKTIKFDFRNRNGRLVSVPDGYAGYFVSARRIADFIPPELHF
jgi:hypothetical protein